MESAAPNDDLRPSPSSLPPSVIAQFNWTAFFWSGAYAFFYNLWSWLSLFVVFGIASRAAFTFLNRTQVSPLAWSLIAVASQVVRFALDAVFGARANREASRKGTLTVAGQLSGQRPWILLGVVLELGGFAVGVFRIVETMPSRTVPILVAFAVRLLLIGGLWSYTTTRARKSG